VLNCRCVKDFLFINFSQNEIYKETSLTCYFTKFQYGIGSIEFIIMKMQLVALVLKIVFLENLSL